MLNVGALRQLPTVPGWPLLGHLLAFRRDPLALLERLASLPGPLWQLRLGSRRVVMASSPEVAEVLLVRLAPALEKGPVVRRWSRLLLGDGLVSTDTEGHAEHRAQLGPTIAAWRSQAQMSALAALCHRAVHALPENVEVDLNQTVRRLVADVIGPALISSDAAIWQPIVDALESVNRYLATRIRNPLLPPIGGPTARARQAAAALRALDDAIESLFQSKRRPVDPPGDLLDHLLAIRNPDGTHLPPRRIRDELVTFLVAALETTSTALTWTLILMALHPDVTRRQREESVVVVGEGGKPEAQHLPFLPLNEQVIKESLRLWPPVHTLGRQVRTKVDLMGTSLPPGTIVAFSTFLLHRRKELYPDPERFLPERFAGGTKSLGRFSFLPFGAGPRACAGGDLALSILRLLVAGIVARHDLVLLPTAQVIPELLVTLRPTGPLPFRFQASDQAMGVGGSRTAGRTMAT